MPGHENINHKTNADIYGPRIGIRMDSIAEIDLSVFSHSLGDTYLTPDISRHNPNYPKDMTGEPYDPREVLGVIRAFDDIGFPRDEISTVLPVVVPAAHFLNQDVTSKTILLPLTVGAIAYALKKGLPNFKISRRGFAALAGTSGLAILAACSPSGQVAIARTFENCKVVLPPLEQSPPEAISQAEYDKLNVFQQADYLLRGGYLKEWIPTKKFANEKEETEARQDFVKKIAQASKLSIISAYAQLIGEDPEDLKSRFFIADTKEEFKALLRKEADIQSENGLNWLADNSNGLQRINNTGKQIFFSNSENHVRIAKDYFASGKYFEIVRIVSNTFAHELSHLLVKNKKSSQDKADLKKWIDQILPLPITEVLDDPDEGLEIRYRVDGDKEGIYHSMLSDIAYDGKDEFKSFDESLREYMQRNFRKRLDNKLGRRSQTPYWSLYDYYTGYELFTYLNSKLGINDDDLADYLNSFRHDENLNIAELIRFYVRSAKQKGVSVSEPQVLNALKNIESSSQVVRQKSDVYEKTVNSTPKEKQSALYDEYVCVIKDFVDAGRFLIDRSLSEKPVKPTPAPKTSIQSDEGTPMMVVIPQSVAVYSFS